MLKLNSDLNHMFVYFKLKESPIRPWLSQPLMVRIEPDSVTLGEDIGSDGWLR